MKKTILTLTMCLLVLLSGHAQTESIIAQPTHVVGKRINAAGEVTATLESDFTYNEDGKPYTFAIPDYALSTIYRFEGNYLNRETTQHYAGHPQLTEDLIYTYEDGKIKTIEHDWSHGYDFPQIWEYSYGEDGRLARKDYMHGIPGVDDFHDHLLYEYENEGKTIIEDHWTSWELEGLLLRQHTVYQYDDDYCLFTQLVENYSVEGDLTSSTLDTYTYTANGKQESMLTQTLRDGEWINTSIMRYFYDNDEQVIEQQDGSWSEEKGEWDITKRITFEYEMLDDSILYTISFYKKDGDEWGWDVFNNQTIFFGSALKNQQRTMRFYQYEEYHSLGMINQFEITFAYTQEPVYMDVEDDRPLPCTLYPNPTNSSFTITGKGLKAAEVLNTLGQQVATSQGKGESMQIDITNLPAGIYFVRITDEEGHKCVRKVVKE